MSIDIVLIDDDVDVTDLMAELLEAEGHRVTKTNNGVDGIAAVVSKRPRVAIIDLGMPVLDGFEVAKVLRQRLGKKVFLIALTAWSDFETKEQCIKSGFDVHMGKPVNFKQLFALLASK